MGAKESEGLKNRKNCQRWKGESRLPNWGFLRRAIHRGKRRKRKEFVNEYKHGGRR